MTKEHQTVIVQLPFDGFYNSVYSDAVDREEESWNEYHTEEQGESDADYEEYWPKPLRLDGGEYGEILMRVTKYHDAYETIARDYVAAFDYVTGEALGYSVKDTRQRWKGDKFEPESYQRPSMRLTYESMDSPREYNFTTDRVYATVPLAMMKLLFNRSKRDNHETLSQVIKERFTSYDGFISSYDNTLPDWLEKPLSDWDHNEFATLLIAAMRLAGSDVESRDVRESLWEATCGDEGAYNAWSNAVDWPKFETERTEQRAEKLADWIEDDKETAMLWCANHSDDCATIIAADPTVFGSVFDDGTLPYRCPLTPDLFDETRDSK